MSKRTLKLLALGLLNASAYHFAYVAYLYAVFEYAGFRYEPTSTGYMVWTYFIAVLPVLAARKSNEPSAVGCALIYVLSYVPIQLTLTFMWAEKTSELMALQSLVGLSMMVMFRASPAGRLAAVPTNDSDDSFFQPGPLTKAINLMSVLGLVMMTLELYPIMKLVSFEDVYDLRSGAAAIKTSSLTNYLIMWLTYCLGPFYIARALIKGRKLDWIFGLGILLLVYSATGSKLALLTPLFMFAMKYIDNGRGEFLTRFLTVVIVFISLIVMMIPQEGIVRWVNAIFLMRVFGSNGWTAAVYYEYFSEHGYTYYNHIGPVNALFSSYPYGDRSLGQEIAKFYFDSDEANFNAGFWASDGFAALGMTGMLFVTAFVFIFLKGLNAVTKHAPLRLINLWFLGFWMALMNAPLMTALLSCGGLLIMALLWFVKPKAKRTALCA